MAEGRMLKRRITLSKKMAALKTDKARLLWFYMLPFTDVDGRINADPEDIRDEILRKQRKGYTNKILSACLIDLDRVGLISLYNISDTWYLELCNFDEHQSLNKSREAKSKLPPPFVKRKCLTVEQHKYVWGRWKNKHFCPLCNKKAEFIVGEGWVIDKYIHFQVDHIIPVSRGGTNDIANLRIICQKCNATRNNQINISNSGALWTTPVISKEKLSKDKRSKEKLSKDNTPPISPPKKTKFLDFVLLTQQEYEKLVEKLGEEKTKDYIERLNSYIGSKGKEYKSHYYTILNWWRKNHRNQSPESTIKQQVEQLEAEGRL